MIANALCFHGFKCFPVKTAHIERIKGNISVLKICCYDFDIDENTLPLIFLFHIGKGKCQKYKC